MKDEIINLASDWSEVAIDAALADGILRDIPVVGTICGLARVGKSVRDLLFLKKVARFLRDPETIDFHDRRAFIDEMSSDRDAAQRLGETVLFALERSESLTKAAILGRLFSRYVARQCDLVTF